MAIVNSKEIFSKALEGKYAIGAFNFINLETLKSILAAATKNNSPVIIQCSTGAIKYAGVKALSAMVYSLCENLTIPVCWNLDHGKTFEDCKMAIDNGFTNVMIDASDKPFEENIKLTKQVVKYAHSRGVTVEAELGVLSGIEDDINVNESLAKYTIPSQAKEFVKKTKVDSLAIAIGTSHGAYKFKGDGTLKLNILKEIEKLLPNYPLVLHGASTIDSEIVAKANKFGAKIIGASGVPQDVLKVACTQHNICKVNVDSDLRIGFLAGIREHIANNPSDIDIRGYLKQGMKEIEQTVDYKLNNIFCSSGKA